MHKTNVVNFSFKAIPYGVLYGRTESHTEELARCSLYSGTSKCCTWPTCIDVSLMLLSDDISGRALSNEVVSTLHPTVTYRSSS